MSRRGPGPRPARQSTLKCVDLVPCHERREHPLIRPVEPELLRQPSSRGRFERREGRELDRMHGVEGAAPVARIVPLVDAKTGKRSAPRSFGPGGRLGLVTLG